MVPSAGIRSATGRFTIGGVPAAGGRRGVAGEVVGVEPGRHGIATHSRPNDVMFVIASADLFREMVGGRRWTIERWREWVGTTVVDDLFEGRVP